MPYKLFTRTWWRDNPEWPDGLEPHAGQRRKYGTVDTEDEALRRCKEWNTTHKPGRYSLKMEFDDA